MSTICLASSYGLWLLAPTLGICGLLLAVWSWSRRRSGKFDRYGVGTSDTGQTGSEAAEEPDITERRHVSRRWGPPVAVFLSEAKVVAAEHAIVFIGGVPGESISFSAEPVEAWVLNRSTEGLCISAPKAIAVGSAVLVRIAVGSKDGPWVKLVVKHCSAVDLRWRLGCQFAQTPPPEVLGVFG